MSDQQMKVFKQKGQKPTIIKIGLAEFGGKQFTVIAGPCSVESEEQTIATARAVKAAGAHMLRGGAFKPRTSPYSFQGLGEEGLKILAKAREVTGLPVVTEVMDTDTVSMVVAYADMLQVGTRNMQNFPLLKAVGKTKKPVMLKRGFSASYDEYLMAAEYIASEGNLDILLCERGIRTFVQDTRNTIDFAMVPVLRERTHLPMIIDPSHGGGDNPLVAPLARASLAIGADGIMVEVHPNPEEALSDKEQALTFDQFAKLMDELKAMSHALGREI